jgi:hypothetical protein
MDELPERPYELPRDVVRAAHESEAKMRDLVQVVQDGALVIRHIRLLELDGKEITASDIQMFLSSVARGFPPNLAERGPQASGKLSLHSPAGKLIAEFIRRFFKRIRDAICGAAKQGYPLSAKATAALAAIAEFLSQHIGLTGAIAKAIATSVLVAILASTKGAFCDMTEEKAMQAILNAARLE